MQIGNVKRGEINQALAKAIAYKNCGNDHAANVWASVLLDRLGASYIHPQSREENVRELPNRY